MLIEHRPAYFWKEKNTSRVTAKRINMTCWLSFRLLGLPYDVSFIDFKISCWVLQYIFSKQSSGNSHRLFELLCRVPFLWPRLSYGTIQIVLLRCILFLCSEKATVLSWTVGLQQGTWFHSTMCSQFNYCWFMPAAWTLCNNPANQSEFTISDLVCIANCAKNSKLKKKHLGLKFSCLEIVQQLEQSHWPRISKDWNSHTGQR